MSEQIGGVVAKMICSSVERTEFQHNQKQIKVKLGAIYGSEGENKDFTDATPSGECWMQIKEGFPASEWFKPGQTYYLHFTEAPQR